jgi:hypothetical protein
MKKPLNQLDLFGLPTVSPVAPTPAEPTINGLHWYTPDGKPAVKTVEWSGGRIRTFPIKYVFEGVEWSGRGRMPWVIDCYQHDKHKGNREKAFAAIEADMVKRGYQRVGGKS